jgi:hypothetical protein
MGSDKSSVGLSSSQERHLLTSAQYADKLFGEIESVLFASKSKSLFRKYRTVSLLRKLIVEDYLARIRAQLVRVLESQAVRIPEPQLGSVHSIRTTLAFIRITSMTVCRLA